MRFGMAGWIMVASLAASSCASLSPAERAARMQQEVEEMIQVYGPACEKLGYQADSDPWRACILKLDHDQSEQFRTRMNATMTDCWGHRGFFHCTSF